MSIFTNKSIKVFKEFASLKDKYNETNDSNKFNYETLDLYLKYDIVDVALVKKLVDRDKLHIKSVDILLKKYGD